MLYLTHFLPLPHTSQPEEQCTKSGYQAVSGWSRIRRIKSHTRFLHTWLG